MTSYHPLSVNPAETFWDEINVLDGELDGQDEPDPFDFGIDLG